MEKLTLIPKIFGMDGKAKKFNKGWREDADPYMTRLKYGGPTNHKIMVLLFTSDISERQMLVLLPSYQEMTPQYLVVELL